MLNQITTAAAAEGFQAYSRAPFVCQYQDDTGRAEWAKGFYIALREDQGSKAWYASKTLLCGMALLALAVGMIVYGSMTKTNLSLTAVGGALTIREILGIGLRLMTNETIEILPHQDEHHDDK